MITTCHLTRHPGGRDGRDMVSWEDDYYGDAIQAARAQRGALRHL